MLVFVFVALPVAPIPSNEVQSLVVVASIAFFVALAVFFGMAALPAQTMTLVEKATSSIMPAKIGVPLLNFTKRFLDGLESLRSFRNVLMIFATSILIWLLETVKYWFVMHAFEFEVSFFALMLMNGVVNLATTLPSAPGYVGTLRHARHRNAETVRRGKPHRHRLHVGVARRLVVARNATGGILHGARRDELGGFWAGSPNGRRRSNSMKIGIVGAGLAGMSAGYDLLKAGHEVTIYEANSYAGGLAAGFRDAGWEWHLEHFYTIFLRQTATCWHCSMRSASATSSFSSAPSPPPITKAKSTPLTRHYAF